MRKNALFILTVILSLLSVFTFLSIFRGSFYIIKGDSMLPTLSHGDLVIITHKNPQEIHADMENGDIVVIAEGEDCYVKYGGSPLFYNAPNGQKIIHRVINKKLVNNTWFFLTCGDNNPYCDGGIREIYRESDDYILFEYNNSNLENLVYIPSNYILGVVIGKIPMIGLLQEIAPFLLFPMIAFIGFFCLMNLSNRKIIMVKRLIKQNLLQSKPFLILSFLIFSHLLIYCLPFMIPNLRLMNQTSMQPYIFYNDLVVSEKRSPSEIRIEDIIVIRGPDYFYSEGFDPIFWNYYPNGSYIIHHVLDKVLMNNSWFFMTGIIGEEDKYSNQIDGMFSVLKKSEDYFLFEFNRSNIIYIPETEVLGVVTARIPLIGYILEFIPYFICYLLLLISIVIYFQITKKKMMLLKIQYPISQ